MVPFQFVEAGLRVLGEMFLEFMPGEKHFGTEATTPHAFVLRISSPAFER